MKIGNIVNSSIEAFLRRLSVLGEHQVSVDSIEVESVDIYRKNSQVSIDGVFWVDIYEICFSTHMLLPDGRVIDKFVINRPTANPVFSREFFIGSLKVVVSVYRHQSLASLYELEAFDMPVTISSSKVSFFALSLVEGVDIVSVLDSVFKAAFLAVSDIRPRSLNKVLIPLLEIEALNKKLVVYDLAANLKSNWRSLAKIEGLRIAASR